MQSHIRYRGLVVTAAPAPGAGWPRTNEEIDRSTLWRWLEPRARELARAYWSGNHALPLGDYQGLMRVHARLLIQKPFAVGLALSVRRDFKDIADEVLEQAINDLGAYHGKTQSLMRKAAASALREHMTARGLANLVVEAVGNRSPRLPRDLEQEALVDAARDIRIEAWQARKGGQS